MMRQYTRGIGREKSMRRRAGLLKMRKVAILALVAAAGMACAQVMAIRQPSRLDRKVLQPGAERAVIVGTLGAPRATEEGLDGLRMTDTYTYTDGGKRNHWGAKAGRIVLYTAGDVFTIFLTQILWIPSEMLLDGTEYSATVEYERRPSDGRWVTLRATETKLGGDRKSTVISNPDAVSSAPPEIEEPTPVSSAVSTGTCFAIGADGHLITAYHVVEGADAISVQLTEGGQLAASLEKMSRGADLAVLRVEAETPDFLVLGSRLPLEVGERVFTIAFPATTVESREARFSEGAIARLPLVTERGEVVGIIASAPASDADPEAGAALPQDLNWAVKADYAVSLVGEGGESAPVGDRNEAIERVRASVCRVDVSRTE
jgi:S1-C subfamily serine protease